MNLEKLKKLIKALGWSDAWAMAIKELGGVDKAYALIDGQELEDADGTKLDIKALKPEPKTEAPANIGELVTAAVAKAFDDLVGDDDTSGTDGSDKPANRRKGRKLRITGGDFRNDDAERFGWKSFNEQLRAIKAANLGQGTDQRLHTKATGMSESVASDGGFLIAPEFANRVMEIAHDENSLLSMTDNFTIGGSTVKVNAVAESSRATGSRRGGVRGYWVNEGGTITSSKPTVRQMTLAPHKLAVLVYATEEQLEDTGQMLGQLVERSAGEEIAFMAGDAIVNGSGAGQPLGILAGAAGTTSCRVEVAKETGQAAATVVFANLTKMWARMHARSRANAAWFINQDVEPQLLTLSLDVGTGGVPAYLPPGGLSQAPYGTIFGRPVIPLEFCATLGTVGDVILADMKQYLTVLKGGVKATASMHVAFLTDESAFKFTYRVDGQPWWNLPLTPFKGTATQSPFVALATRA